MSVAGIGDQDLPLFDLALSDLPLFDLPLLSQKYPQCFTLILYLASEDEL